MCLCWMCACPLCNVSSPKAASVSSTANRKVFQGSASVYRQGYVLQMKTPRTTPWSPTDSRVTPLTPYKLEWAYASCTCDGLLGSPEYHLYRPIHFQLEVSLSAYKVEIINANSHSVLFMVSCVHRLNDLLLLLHLFYWLNDGTEWFCVPGRTFGSPSDWCCSKGLLHVMTHTEILVLLVWS